MFTGITASQLAGKLLALDAHNFWCPITALRELDYSFREADIVYFEYRLQSNSLTGMLRAEIILYTRTAMAEFVLNQRPVMPKIIDFYTEDVVATDEVLKSLEKLKPVLAELKPLLSELKPYVFQGWKEPMTVPNIPRSTGGHTTITTPYIRPGSTVPTFGSKSRRKVGGIKFVLPEQKFICTCWKDDQYCAHVKDFFEAREDRQLLNGLAFNNNKVIAVPLAEGYAYASVTVSVYPASLFNPSAAAEEVIFNVQDVLGNEILLQDNQSLIDVIRFLEDFYSVTEAAEKMKLVLARSLDIPCTNKRHTTVAVETWKTAREARSYSPQQITIGESYYLTTLRKCRACAAASNIDFAADAPEL